MQKLLLGLLGLTLSVTTLRADDWPQWRGPNRDGVSKEVGLLKAWPVAGPKVNWTFPNAGAGYSTPAVVGETLYCTGGRGTDEFLYALDVKTGKETWSVKIGPLFKWPKGNTWNTGPSATPTVVGDSIYALGGNGDLVCCSTAGKIVWSKNLPATLGAEVNPIGGAPDKRGWGFAWSPLVDGNKIICLPGGPKGTMAALNTKSGETLWQCAAVADQASYSSPVVATFKGVKQYIALTNTGLFSVSEAGKLLWQHKASNELKDVVIPTPIVLKDQVFFSAGFGSGSELISLADGKPATVYEGKRLDNREGGLVLVGEHIYGHTDLSGWVCLTLTGNKPAWAERRKLDRGSILAADGLLYLLSEKGELVLIEANPKAWTELSRFTLPTALLSEKNLPNGRVWTPPVLSNGKLYVRDQEKLTSFQVK